MSNYIMVTNRRVKCIYSASDYEFTKNQIYKIKYDSRLVINGIIEIIDNNGDIKENLPFNGNVWKFELLSYDKKEPIIVDDMQPLIKLLTKLNTT